MKKTLLFAAMMLLVATAAFAGISNTAHNLSSVGMTQEICAYCHTPHFANTLMTPLWNRVLSTATFTFYGLTVRGTNANSINPSSSACMSCHDGVTSINALTNVPGPGLGTAGTVIRIGTEIANPNPTATYATLIGTDLSNDHPISIGYNTAFDLNTPALASTDGIIRVNGPGAGTNVTGGTTIECVSCHDPHVETPALFLRTSNANSALCLACHNK
jgi:predicted CXXCH cytochrome family protein